MAGMKNQEQKCLGKAESGNVEAVHVKERDRIRNRAGSHQYK
jgi:hypothetical protein